MNAALAPRSVAPAPRGVAPAPRGVAPAPRGVAPTPRSVAPAPRGVAFLLCEEPPRERHRLAQLGGPAAVLRQRGVQENVLFQSVLSAARFRQRAGDAFERALVHLPRRIAIGHERAAASHPNDRELRRLGVRGEGVPFEHVVHVDEAVTIEAAPGRVNVTGADVAEVDELPVTNGENALGITAPRVAAAAVGADEEISILPMHTLADRLDGARQGRHDRHRLDAHTASTGADGQLALVDVRSAADRTGDDAYRLLQKHRHQRGCRQHQNSAGS